MTKEEYNKLYEDNTEIKMPDEFIRDWADRITFYMNAAEDASYELHFGAFLNTKDEYTHNIEPCSHRNFHDYHIYRGIELLAAACGATLQKEVDRESESYPIKKWFYHRGVRFFEFYKDENYKQQSKPEEEATE